MNSLAAISLIPVSIASSTIEGGINFSNNFLFEKSNNSFVQTSCTFEAQRGKDDLFLEFDKRLMEYEKSKLILETLTYLLNEVNDEYSELRFVSFVKEYQNTREFAVAVSLFFSDNTSYEKQCNFLDILLSSDFDVFVPWYKMALFKSSNSKSKTLCFIADSILKRYSKSFDKVEHVFN